MLGIILCICTHSKYFQQAFIKLQDMKYEIQFTSQLLPGIWLSGIVENIA